MRKKKKPNIYLQTRTYAGSALKKAHPPTLFFWGAPLKPRLRLLGQPAPRIAWAAAPLTPATPSRPPPPRCRRTAAAAAWRRSSPGPPTRRPATRPDRSATRATARPRARPARGARCPLAHSQLEPPTLPRARNGPIVRVSLNPTSTDYTINIYKYFAPSRSWMLVTLRYTTDCSRKHSTRSWGTHHLYPGFAC